MKKRHILPLAGAFLMAAFPIPHLHAQYTLLDENFDRGNAGGRYIPGSPATNTTGFSSGNPPSIGVGPGFYPGDEALIVDDLRGGASGKAFQFLDKLSTGTMALRYNYAALPDGTPLTGGRLSVGFDFMIDLKPGESFKHNKYVMNVDQWGYQGSSSSTSRLSWFGLYHYSSGGTDEFRFIATNSSEGVSSTLVTVRTAIEVNTLYRMVFDYDMSAGEYHLNVFNAGGDLFYRNETPWLFLGTAETRSSGASQAFRVDGGSVDPLTMTGGDSGVIVDNVLVTYAIPEPGAGTAVLLGGAALLLARRRPNRGGVR